MRGPGVCPSGQRERAVNPSAQPTEVRILPPPSPVEVRLRLRRSHDDFARHLLSSESVWEPRPRRSGAAAEKPLSTGAVERSLAMGFDVAARREDEVEAGS